MSTLELSEVSLSFGAVAALSGVDLTLRSAEVVGLMGDNGAGKSTLVKVLAGDLSPRSGAVRLDGSPVGASPSSVREAGIEVVYQSLALCANLTATANIFLGRELTRSRLGLGAFLDHRTMTERAGELLSDLGSETPPEAEVRRLSGGQRQAVAIARAQLSSPKFVLMDEPTAAISVRQIDEVLALIRRLREQGVGVLLISHRMSDVFAVADRVVVLRRGRKVADVASGATSAETVTGWITGAIEGSA